MRIKSTFRFLCFVMIFFSLACWIVSVHAASESSPCTSYLSAYLSAVEALESARETRDAVRVAVIKATPYVSVPSELQDLEDEYDSDPDGFYKTLEGMGVGLPGYVSGPISEMQRLEIRKALSDAEAAYNTVSTAYDSAKKSLEDCTGVTVVTIWCERGVNCQNPPGVQGRPKAHYIFDCPDKIKGLLGIVEDCPGTWWSCDGVNLCPRSLDHRVTGPCPDGDEKHTYTAGSPGDHGQKVMCGVTRGRARVLANGKRVQDTCQVSVAV